MTMPGLKVRPITGSIGAEITGVDLSKVSDAQWDSIYQAWLENLVLFFPEQHLDADAHVELARRFGDIEIHPYIAKLDESHPEVVVLDSENGGNADIWHTDVTFIETPPMASILRMVICPPKGGDTLWTNQYLVYESLSAPIRDLLEGLTAVHTAQAFGRPDTTATHPVVRVHPETGRKSLFVNRTFTSHLVELRRSESNVLLEYLYGWSEQPLYSCRYTWREGAIGIWDNPCTQHYAVNDYTDRRLIHRVTVLGDRPTGAETRWAAETRAANVADARLKNLSQSKGVDQRTTSVPVKV